MTFHCTSMSEPRPLHADTVCAKSVTNMRRMTSFARQLKQVPEWSWILSECDCSSEQLEPTGAMSCAQQQHARRSQSRLLALLACPACQISRHAHAPNFPVSCTVEGPNPVAGGVWFWRPPFWDPTKHGLQLSRPCFLEALSLF